MSNPRSCRLCRTVIDLDQRETYRHLGVPGINDIVCVPCWLDYGQREAGIQAEMERQRQPYQDLRDAMVNLWDVSVAQARHDALWVWRLATGRRAAMSESPTCGYCRDCEWWGKEHPNGISLKRHCEREQDGYSLVYAARNMWTAPNYGCVQFVAKDGSSRSSPYSCIDYTTYGCSVFKSINKLVTNSLNTAIKPIDILGGNRYTGVKDVEQCSQTLEQRWPWRVKTERRSASGMPMASAL